MTPAATTSMNDLARLSCDIRNLLPDEPGRVFDDDGTHVNNATTSGNSQSYYVRHGGDHRGAHRKCDARASTSLNRRSWQNFLDSALRLYATLNKSLVEAHHLTLNDVRLLDVLDKSATGSARMGDLAEDLMSLPSRVTRQIHRLETQKLVRAVFEPRRRPRRAGHHHRRRQEAAAARRW